MYFTFGVHCPLMLFVGSMSFILKKTKITFDIMWGYLVLTHVTIFFKSFINLEIDFPLEIIKILNIELRKI